MNTNDNMPERKSHIVNRPLQIIVVILSMVFLKTNTFAQTEEWKTEKTEDGKISVTYNISKRTDESGEHVPLVEYRAVALDRISFKKCISVMKDVSKHKEFQGDNISEKIKTISEKEWILYYYTKGAGPIPDADCVAQMTFSEDTINKIAVFTITAAPYLFEKKNVRRVTYYNETYTFKETSIGNVEVTVTAKMSPAFKVPLWMIKAAFPSAGFDVVRKFVKLTKEN